MKLSDFWIKFAAFNWRDCTCAFAIVAFAAYAVWTKRQNDALQAQQDALQAQQDANLVPQVQPPAIQAAAPAVVPALPAKDDLQVLTSADEFGQTTVTIKQDVWDLLVEEL